MPGSFRLGLWFALSVWLASLRPALCGDMEIWEAPRPGEGKSVKLEDRTAWKGLHTAGRVENCMILENNKLTLVIAPGSEGAVVHSKGLALGRRATAGLFLEDSRGETAPIQAVQLTSFTETEALAQATLRDNTQVSFRLRRGETFVEVIPGEKAASLRVAALARYVFRPDLYGTDVLYTPAMPMFAGKDRVPVPLEHYLLSVLSPDCALICTWPGAEQRVELRVSGPSQDRKFTAAQVSFGAGGKKSVFVGLLEAPGICRGEELKGAEAGLAEAPLVSLQPQWEAPFPARWYTLIWHGERKGARSSLYLPVEVWPLAGKIVAGRLATWSKGGEMWTEDDRNHKPRRVAWYDGRRWGLDLEKSCEPFVLALNYPLGRVIQTPASASTVIDQVRETLPETWGKVLDIKGLEPRGKYKGEGRMVVATCAGHYELAKMAADKAAQADTREQAQALERFLQVYHERSQEYLKFSAQIREVCAGAAQRSPKVKGLADRLVSASKEMETEWERLRNEGGLDPDKWGPGVKQIYAVIDAWPADTQTKLEGLRGVVTEPGSRYSSFVAIARKIARNLHYLAVYGAGEDDETLKLAAEVRNLCHQVMRNRYFKEDQYGESIWGPLANPEKPR